jgi:hypothetical protein
MPYGFETDAGLRAIVDCSGARSAMAAGLPVLDA